MSLTTPAIKRKKDSTKWSQIKISTPVGVSATIRDAIAAKLESKPYRDAYVKATLKHGLAHQIRINRVSRGLTQAQLAELCGESLKQTTISRLEDTAYGNFSISTLLKVASALDVALLVKLVPYSKFLLETCDKTVQGLTAREFSAEDLHIRQAQLLVTENRPHYLKQDKPLLSEQPSFKPLSVNNKLTRNNYLGSSKGVVTHD